MNWEEVFSLLSNYFRKKKSKKGFSLVEALCSVMILAIVFAGVLNSVVFSRQIVLTQNIRDVSSDRGQLIADELITICMKYNPDEYDATNHNQGVNQALAAIQAEIDSVINYADDPQYNDEIGGIAVVNTFTDATSFNPNTDKRTQVKIQFVEESITDKTDHKEIKQAGWDITVRLYYQAIGSQGPWQGTDITAFAPMLKDS